MCRFFCSCRVRCCTMNEKKKSSEYGTYDIERKLVIVPVCGIHAVFHQTGKLSLSGARIISL